MTIQEAYHSWMTEPVNKMLANRTAMAWRNVWQQLDTAIQCADVTVHKLVTAISQLRFSTLQDRVQASSVMVHVLRHAHQQHPDTCPEPAFTYGDIVQQTKDDRHESAVKRLHQPLFSTPPEPVTVRKPRKEAQCRRIIGYRIDGQKVLYDSAQKMAKHYSVTASNIWAHIRKKRPFRGMLLAYEGDDKPVISKPVSVKPNHANGHTTGTYTYKPVVMMQFDSRKRKHHRREFPTCQDAADYLNVSRKHVANHIYSGKPIHGLYFCYKRDEDNFHPIFPKKPNKSRKK